MAVALIVAAGSGERLGLGRPKALVPVGGRPMLEWSIGTLRAVSAVELIVVALPEQVLGEAPDGVRVVAGGTTRSQSVRAALAAAPFGDPVIVHDAARPFASVGLFTRCVERLERSADCDAVIAAARVTDTVKEVGDDGRTVVRTLERSRLWAVQTPQVFRRGALERALEAPDEVLEEATDDAWLVERAGGVVEVLQSDPGNLKVTTPADLALAEQLITRRREPAR